FSANGGISTKLRLLSLEGVDGKPARPRLDREGTFGFDPTVAVAHLRKSDAALGRIIDRVGPFEMRLKHASSLFAALAEAIVYQQLSGKAAATIFGRVCALFPSAPAGVTARQILSVSDENLRAAGLSRSKLLALQDLAERSEAGEIPTLVQIQRWSDDEIVERLSEVRGIGRWTVEMLLMFALSREDVFAIDDLGIQNAMIKLYKLDREDKKKFREDMLRISNKWSPYRTYACKYLWEWKDNSPTI
ncbi:MAG TPA: hypothetical protein VK644_00525, partial [Chitinophagaceae bacterium]|nr:hypothetical protein [Chitinophagaceae bacterium]